MAGSHSIKAGVHFTGDIGPNRIKILTIASNRNCASDKGNWALDFFTRSGERIWGRGAQP